MQKFWMAGLFSIFSICALAQTQPLKFINAQDNWNPDSLGNHRVLVLVKTKGDVAKVIIPWRRRDENPQEKNIVVIDGQTNMLVKNVKAEDISREKGIIYFQPTSGPGKYYVYYMAYHLKGTFYPQTFYKKPTENPSTDWLSKVNHSAISAVATELQSVDAFNSFYPMEVIATEKETNALITKNKGKDYLVFPEDRMHPIRMTKDLPQRWIPYGAKNTFSDETLRGENFTYQLGVYPIIGDLKNVKVSFSDLKARNGAVISKNVMECINNKGVNWLGVPETFTVNVPQRTVQALWCTIDVPNETKPGQYTGTATITADNARAITIKISLKVANKVAINHGVNEPWKQTRLTWLNSTIYEKNTVIKPYLPLERKGDEIELLGRKFTIAKTGFPAQIQSFFTQAMTGIGQTPKNILEEPIHFHFIKTDGKNIAFTNSPINYIEQTPGTIAWQVDNISPEIDMNVVGALEFDGFVNYTVRVVALQNVDLKDVEMHIPFEPAIAKYTMGLGSVGQQRPDSVIWKWDVANKNQDGAWVGDVNGGLQYSLRDQHYTRPLNTNFYLQKPLVLPTSWGNEHKGGIDIFLKGSSVLANNYTGPRSMKKGDTLFYNFRLLITPFHTLDTKDHFANRYLHKYVNPDTAKSWGVSVINIHQGTPINAYINYPFIQTKEMKAYIDSAHRDGIKVKIYNTVRELSNRAYELPALFSLGNEIYSKGKGGGYSWLHEHLDPTYISGWFTPEVKDAAIINGDMSRWHNYYVEGMGWLTKNIGIDGVYLDDVAFDRDIMKRIKRALTQDDHAGLIDLHSASQYDKADGYINSAMLYMELFPYINRLWFGEKFDYENTSKDYYLTEMSGIPFGLMGEMLEHDGNPWRGMVYGMTDRLKWSETADPRPLWKLWDAFGIEDAEMIGYWADNNPIKSDNENVPVTIYKKDKSVLISLASWAKEEVNVHLKIDWKALGIDPANANIIAPAIDKFQPARSFKVGEAIPVEPNKGWLLEIK